MRTCRICGIEVNEENSYIKANGTKCKNCYNKHNNLLKMCKLCSKTRINYSIKDNKTLCRNCYIEENMGSDIVFDLLDKGSSKGEKEITKILKKKGKKFKAEHTFKDQGDFNEVITRCRFDFYLEEERTIIEFHGKQHYHYTPYFHRGGIMSFYKCLQRDFIKKIYCYYKGMKFIEIRYDENIECKINKHIKD